MRRFAFVPLLLLLTVAACKKATVRYPTQLSFEQAFDLVFERGSFPPLARKPATAIFVIGKKGVQVFQTSYATHVFLQGPDGLARYEWTGKADKNSGVFRYEGFVADKTIADLEAPN